MELKRFYLGVFMIVAGIIMLFIAMFLPPVGNISHSVLTAFGEISLLAGCLCGADVYVNYKIRKFIENNKQEKKEE